MFSGFGASEGYAIGRLYILKQHCPDICEEETSFSVSDEMTKLDKAITIAEDQLKKLYDQTKTQMGEEQALIFDSHLIMLSDPEFIDLINRSITDEKSRAAAAIKKASEYYVNIFEAMDDEYMRARTADIRDVAKRLIRIVSGVEDEDVMLPDNAIVLAYDLSPSDTIKLDRSKVSAFVTETGSITSHSAIMARSMQIPAVLGAEGILAHVSQYENNQMPLCIVDGFLGKIIINPDEAILLEYKEKSASYQEVHINLMKYRNLSLSYTSGRRIKVAGNIGSPEELDLLVEYGAEGIGLFRTEFLFMERKQMPDENEQMLIYKKIAQRMGNNAVVIRTLDIGGDKVIPYLNMPKEENPFLGVRALRLCLNRPDIFKTQLRAILRASNYGNLHIMFPMIGSLQELDQAVSVLEECKKELLQEGFDFKEDMPIGMMIEIPAAAIQAADFAKKVDFFSIGTNDLIQYTLAVDRMNSGVAKLYNPYHPAVLALIEMTIKAAHQEGIWCGMCGEMASDPAVIKMLAELELDEFSVSGGAILKIREQLLKQSIICSKDTK